MDEGYGIAAFRSRQQVLRFEAALKREGVQNVQVISTPREVAVGCGLSVQFPLSETQAVLGAVNRSRPVNLIGVYQVSKQPNGRNKLTAIAK